MPLVGPASSSASSRLVPVTSLPGSPVTGDVCVYQTAAMAALSPPIAWQLVYDGTKWAYIGGAPWVVEVSAAESTTSGTFVALTTAGPAIALPVAGDYDVKVQVFTHNTVGNNYCLMSYDIGATPAANPDGLQFDTGATMTDYASVSQERRKTGLTAVTLTCKYAARGLGSAALFKNRKLSVRPVRLG